MYQHLLVPLDESALSIANVGEAVRLAQGFAAPPKLTFFHATPAYAASAEGTHAREQLQDKLHRVPVLSEGSGLPLRALTHDEYRDRVLGESRALLAKACTAAAAAQLVYDTHSVVSEQPAEAIVAAARDCHCDLIVMASHGRTGLRALLSPSIATKVMRQAGVAVLVTNTESTDAHVEASHAIALIQDEHRSLAAVLHGMKRRVAEASSAAEPLDHAAFGKLLQYVHDFPEKRHHPKEEQSLHRLLRDRGDRGREVMHTLEAQHLEEYALADTLQQAWTACGAGASGGDAALLRLEQATTALAEHTWKHMALEEQTLLPLALEVLSADDWKEVAETFDGNRDPGYGEWSEEDFRRHFTKRRKSRTAAAGRNQRLTLPTQARAQAPWRRSHVAPLEAPIGTVGLNRM